jgi:hypothetical protein
MAVNAFYETTFLCFYGNVLVTSFTVILRYRYPWKPWLNLGSRVHVGQRICKRRECPSRRQRDASHLMHLLLVVNRARSTYCGIFTQQRRPLLGNGCVNMQQYESNR